MDTEHHSIWSRPILPILEWKLENPIGFVITFCTFTAQVQVAASPRPLKVTAGNAGNHWLKPKGSQQLEGENKFTTAALPMMFRNKAAKNRQCLDSKASVSSKGGMQLSHSSWWKIRASVATSRGSRNCKSRQAPNKGDLRRISLKSSKWFNSDASSYV